MIVIFDMSFCGIVGECENFILIVKNFFSSLVLY